MAARFCRLRFETQFSWLMFKLVFKYHDLVNVMMSSTCSASHFSLFLFSIYIHLLNEMHVRLKEFFGSYLFFIYVV